MPFGGRFGAGRPAGIGQVSGLAGIGTTSPAAKIDIKGDTSVALTNPITVITVETLSNGSFTGNATGWDLSAVCGELEGSLSSCTSLIAYDNNEVRYEWDNGNTYATPGTGVITTLSQMVNTMTNQQVNTWYKLTYSIKDPVTGAYAAPDQGFSITLSKQAYDGMAANGDDWELSVTEANNQTLYFKTGTTLTNDTHYFGIQVVHANFGAGCPADCASSDPDQGIFSIDDLSLLDATLVTCTAHGLVAGQAVKLPTGNSGNTEYEVFTVSSVPHADYFIIDSAASNTAAAQTGYKDPVLLNVQTGDGVSKFSLAADGTPTASGLVTGTGAASGENVVIGVAAGTNAAAAADGLVAIGDTAAGAVTSGEKNTAVGFEALKVEDDGDGNTAVGYRALVAQTGTSGDVKNTAVGAQAGAAVTTGVNNVFVGAGAGATATTVSQTVAIGEAAMEAAVTFGVYASANDALELASVANLDTFTIDVKTYITDGEGLVTFKMLDDVSGGAQAATIIIHRDGGGMSTDADRAEAVTRAINGLTTNGQSKPSGGTFSAEVIILAASGTGQARVPGITATRDGTKVDLVVNSLGTNTNDIALADTAGNVVRVTNFSGGQTPNGTIAIGSEALKLLTTGDGNLAIGTGVLRACTTGNHNIGIGTNTLSSAQSLGAGSNIAIGYGTNYTTTTGTSTICIGPSSQPTSPTAYGEIVIGAHVTGVGGNNSITIGSNTGTATLDFYSGDEAWAAASDERLKENIITSDAGLSFINDLRPITYNWKKKKDVPTDMPQYVENSDDPCLGIEHGRTNHGFVAQEIKTVIDNHPEVKEGFSMWKEWENGTQALAPGTLVPMLVKAVQELSAKVTELEAKLDN